MVAAGAPVAPVPVEGEPVVAEPVPTAPEVWAAEGVLLVLALSPTTAAERTKSIRCQSRHCVEAGLLQKASLFQPSPEFAAVWRSVTLSTSDSGPDQLTRRESRSVVIWN